MYQVTEYGESVYVPSGRVATRAEPAVDMTGPRGRWLRIGDSGYESALEEQRMLEELWNAAREETGDG